MDCIKTNFPGPKIGHTSNSETYGVEIYDNIADTGGYNDSNGIEVGIYN